MSTTKRVCEGSDNDSDYTTKTTNTSCSDDDGNNSTMDTMSDSELVRLYKERDVNVHKLLGSSDEDDTDEDTENHVDKKELVALYKDQQVPIEQLAPIANVEASHKSIFSMARRFSLGSYLFKFAIPVAVVMAFMEPFYRQSHDTGLLFAEAIYFAFILCAPVLLINYSYQLKIDALVRDIIVELQAKRERHIRYPNICPSAAVSVTHIRSNIVNPTHLSTFEDWQCVEEKLNAHPLLRKTMQEERGDFIEYWEILV